MGSDPQDDFYARQGYPRPPQPSYRPPPVPPTTPACSPPTSQIAAPAASTPGPSSQGTPPAPPGPPKWWRRNLAIIVPWVLVAALTVTVVVLLFPSESSDVPAAEADTVDDAGPATEDVTVNFLLLSSSCYTSGGYSDIGPGTPVTIKSGDGEILGASSLGAGSPAGSDCLWTLTIPDVRLGEDFYSAEVGSRGAITHSAAELEASGFTFDLSLG